MRRLLQPLGLFLALTLLVHVSFTNPKVSSGLIFPHKYHVQEVGVRCELCHVGVEKSRAAGERFLPDMDVCSPCHDVESESGCRMCHSDPANVVTTPAPGSGYEVFSHSIHTVKLECKTCHTVQAGQTDAGSAYPNMKDCADCHGQKNVMVSCDQCHAAGTPSEPASHQTDWRTGHALDARFDAGECTMCHQAVGASLTCDQCHSGAAFQSPHPSSFVHSRAKIRGGGLADCQTCHEPETFCAPCHQQQLIMPFNHNRPGWAMPRPSTGGIHVRKAEDDLESCVICHASLHQQPTCFSTGCHQ